MMAANKSRKRFRVIHKSGVRDVLDQFRDSCPWLDQVYADAKARLGRSGHIEGRRFTKIPGLRRMVAVDRASGCKRLVIIYLVGGNNLTVCNLWVVIDGGQISN
jgi:hypothetical protein